MSEDEREVTLREHLYALQRKQTNLWSSLRELLDWWIRYGEMPEGELTKGERARFICALDAVDKALDALNDCEAERVAIKTRMEKARV
jgi:hypothetical protein